MGVSIKYVCITDHLIVNRLIKLLKLSHRNVDQLVIFLWSGSKWEPGLIIRKSLVKMRGACCVIPLATSVYNRIQIFVNWTYTFPSENPLDLRLLTKYVDCHSNISFSNPDVIKISRFDWLNFIIFVYLCFQSTASQSYGVPQRTGLL